MHVVIDSVEPLVFDVPTDAALERDGTAQWSSTTMVLARVRAGGVDGIGYTYVSGAAAAVIRDILAPALVGSDPFAIAALSIRMGRSVRNHGRSGIAACAIAAVDTALWDLKARLLGTSVSVLLGPARGDIPVYASGGFTSESAAALEHELATYANAGYRRVKIKIGQPVASAIERVRLASAVLGGGIELMVDGNGAFSRKEATRLAAVLEDLGVRYFEEPVSSDDTSGLRSLRDRLSLDVAAGEYSYLPVDSLRLLDAGAVDILQADATRCMGVSGFLQVDALCDAFEVPLSAHCAPALHAHVARAARRLVHIEHFFDHVRLERMVFEDVPELRNGALTCDWSRPGLGLQVRWREARRFAA